MPQTNRSQGINQAQINALQNIYISPLELCNLSCRRCYTRKTKNILSNEVILDFVKRYNGALAALKDNFSRNFNASALTAAKNLSERPRSVKSILFCGGEVFTLPQFPDLVNTLQSQGIFISLITNGTVDHLEKITDPGNCQLLVSFDGPKEVHDHNRGIGMFDRSLKFVDHALELGFPVEIMFLVTPESYPHIGSFNIRDLTLNYITVKTKFFDDSLSAPGLTPDQIINIKRNYRSIPDRNFGCFQLSLQSNGNLYGCCESPYPLGKMSEDLNLIIGKFIRSLDTCTACGKCGSCTSPDFLCGYKRELNLVSCQKVAKTFTSA